MIIWTMAGIKEIQLYIRSAIHTLLHVNAISEMFRAQVANLVGYVVGPSGIKLLISKMIGKDGELQFHTHKLR